MEGTGSLQSLPQGDIEKLSKQGAKAALQTILVQRQALSRSKSGDTIFQVAYLAAKQVDFSGTTREDTARQQRFFSAQRSHISAGIADYLSTYMSQLWNLEFVSRRLGFRAESADLFEAGENAARELLAKFLDKEYTGRERGLFDFSIAQVTNEEVWSENESRSLKLFSPWYGDSRHNPSLISRNEFPSYRDEGSCCPETNGTAEHCKCCQCCIDIERSKPQKFNTLCCDEVCLLFPTMMVLFLQDLSIALNIVSGAVLAVLTALPSKDGCLSDNVETVHILASSEDSQNKLFYYGIGTIGAIYCARIFAEVLYRYRATVVQKANGSGIPQEVVDGVYVESLRRDLAVSRTVKKKTAVLSTDNVMPTCAFFFYFMLNLAAFTLAFWSDELIDDLCGIKLDTDAVRRRTVAYIVMCASLVSNFASLVLFMLARGWPCCKRCAQEGNKADVKLKFYKWYRYWCSKRLYPGRTAHLTVAILRYNGFKARYSPYSPSFGDRFSYKWQCCTHWFNCRGCPESEERCTHVVTRLRAGATLAAAVADGTSRTNTPGVRLAWHVIHEDDLAHESVRPEALDVARRLDESLMREAIHAARLCDELGDTEKAREQATQWRNELDGFVLRLEQSTASADAIVAHPNAEIDEYYHQRSSTTNRLP